MAVPWKAFCVVLGALSLIIAGLYLGRAGTPRVGVDWAHHQFMLPPGAELPIIPPPPAGQTVSGIKRRHRSVGFDDDA